MSSIFTSSRHEDDDAAMNAFSTRAGAGAGAGGGVG